MSPQVSEIFGIRSHARQRLQRTFTLQKLLPGSRMSFLGTAAPFKYGKVWRDGKFGKVLPHAIIGTGADAIEIKLVKFGEPRRSLRFYQRCNRGERKTASGVRFAGSGGHSTPYGRINPGHT